MKPDIFYATSLKNAPAVQNLAIGSFDGLHVGHMNVICGGQCDAVLTFSGQRRDGFIMGHAEQMNILADTEVKTLINIPFDDIRGLEPAEFIELLCGTIKPKRLAVGENFRFGKQASGDIAALEMLCRERCIKLYTAPYAVYNGEPVSSTRIREAITAGDMTAAAAMLGRPHFVVLPVTEGEQRGRRMGFHTINQLLPNERVILRYGVYGSNTIIDDEKYPSVTNIGVRPTFGRNVPNIETHILSFDNEVYGRNIIVEFLEYYREERQFSSSEELVRQISLDVKCRIGKE